MKKITSDSRNKPTLSENKSNLAKLMATENITVRHRPIKTAKFDLKNRVLHCPIWTEMDGDLYDLLMGHEISHALNTPLLGWHDTLESDIRDKTRPRIKSFLNIIEDARIEKIIKRKYPGLRRPFANAYKGLHERDLFKTARLKGDYSKLRLIDRINLFFKVGAHLQIEFDSEEQVFVDRAENIETFEEAAQLARDIYDYAKNKEPEKEKQDCNNPDKKQEKGKSKKDKSQDDSSNDDSEGDESEDGDNGTSEGDEDANNVEDPSDDSEDGDEDTAGNVAGDPDSDSDCENDDDCESGDEDNDNKKSSGGKNAGRNEDNSPIEEPKAETDDAFREHEKQLVNEMGEAILYLDMPDPNLKNIIIPHSMVLGKYETSIVAQMQHGKGTQSHAPLKPMNYYEVANGLNAAFHKRNKGFINMLVKEFEMRKNANQYARQLTAKTGELDDKKLSRYRLTMDVFRKVTTVTKGKSHGMIMFLDFSGSMAGIVREILEQVLVLCTFCKRIGIPFDVYGFGDSHSYPHGGKHVTLFTPVNDGFDFSKNSFCLRHLISSDLGGNAYKRAFTMLNVVGQISNSTDRDPESSKCFNDPNYTGNFFQLGYELGGTPFNECLVASKTIIELFKAKHHVDITNVIYLSDGDGYGSVTNGRSYDMVPITERQKTRIGVRDYKTKLGVLSDNQTEVPHQAALTKLVAAVTGCRHIGYYFGSSVEIVRKITANKDLKKDLQKHVKFLKENGFVSASNIGYDNYYYVNNENMTYRGELKFYPQTDHKMMGQKFIEHQQKKMNSKLIIKEFAADIAE